LVKEAVESGYWLLIEYENRILKMNVQPKFTGLKEFLSKQGRFRDISDEQTENLRKHIERKYHIYRNMENNNHL
jgi:pyruvate/2-oxoacid:ferredoxin oxidoreductase beta subunit